MATSVAHIKHCSNRQCVTGRISHVSSLWKECPQNTLTTSCSQRGLVGTYFHITGHECLTSGLYQLWRTSRTRIPVFMGIFTIMPVESVMYLLTELSFASKNRMLPYSLLILFLFKMLLVWVFEQQQTVIRYFTAFFSSSSPLKYNMTASFHILFNSSASHRFLFLIYILHQVDGWGM
jgi:hypothetical protein